MRTEQLTPNTPVKSTLCDKLIMAVLVGLAGVGVWFFLTHWNIPMTNATILSAILVELQIQFYFQKIKKNA